MGRFSKVAKADVNGGGKWFVEGSFIVRVEKLKEVQSRQNDDLLFVECTVVETSTPKNDVGTRASYCMKINSDSFGGNMKAFVAATQGIDPEDSEELDKIPDDEWEPLCEYAVHKDQPLRGTYLQLTTMEIITKKEKKPYTVHKWGPIDQAAAESAYVSVTSEAEEEEEEEAE